MQIKGIEDILTENKRRLQIIKAKFNPITGEGSVGDRHALSIDGLGLPVHYIPKEMLKIPLVKELIKYKSVRSFIENGLKEEYTDEDADKVLEQFLRLRQRYDFPFWAAYLAYIKAKGGGEDVLFRLNRPQRRLVEKLERMRLAGKPIRLVLLKARQWGGSTCIQLYMAWLQLMHKVGLNSLIVGHLSDSSAEVKDMFDRMIKAYPVRMLYKLGEAYSEKEAKLVGVGGKQNIQRIPQRNCKIKLGTAESPNSARGGDYNLVHCTEVGIWQKTEGKTPEDIIRSACGGVLYKSYTMIIYESTANGTGNFFHREYLAAKAGESQFDSLFISWFEIDQYSLDFDSEEDKRAFAERLWLNRGNEYAEHGRTESGRYYYWLFTLGATLEAINWYIVERSGKSEHAQMASEYPSNDIEAFVHSGAKVFNQYQVEDLRPACRTPKVIGDVYGREIKGEGALRDIKFAEDRQGQLAIWEHPEIYPDERILNRYLVVVDIGGRSHKSDWSVIAVFDRIDMMDGGKATIVAQWYGHIDMDILAWKSAQIAAYYDNALLVIESNTLETRDRDRQVDGDQSLFILNQIKDVYSNLYARDQSEDEIRERAPLKYGFHTNTATKPMIISNLIMSLREKLYTERDEGCLDEYLNYEKKPNGAFGAIAGKHDDRLMTRAIGMYISLSKMPLPKCVDKARKTTKKRTAISEATI